MKLTKGKIKKYLLKVNQTKKMCKNKNLNLKQNLNNSCTYKKKQTFNLRTRTLKNLKL